MLNIAWVDGIVCVIFGGMFEKYFVSYCSQRQVIQCARVCLYVCARMPKYCYKYIFLSVFVSVDSVGF